MFETTLENLKLKNKIETVILYVICVISFLTVIIQLVNTAILYLLYHKEQIISIVFF
jgi:hypothetical protein